MVPREQALFHRAPCCRAAVRALLPRSTPPSQTLLRHDAAARGTRAGQGPAELCLSCAAGAQGGAPRRQGHQRPARRAAAGGEAGAFRARSAAPPPLPHAPLLLPPPCAPPPIPSSLPFFARAQERGERLAAKRKLKAENEFKSAQTQEISDPTKLKRMSKKQLRAIKRVRVNDDGVRELVPAYS